MSGGVWQKISERRALYSNLFAIFYPFTVGTLLFFASHTELDGFVAIVVYTIAPVYPVLLWRWLPSLKKRTEVFLFGKKRNIALFFSIPGVLLHCLWYTWLMLFLMLFYTFEIGCALGYGCH